MKKILYLLFALLISICAFGLVACGDEEQSGGANGANGADGKSAYEIWLDAGNSGSEEDFLNWLRGDSASVDGFQFIINEDDGGYTLYGRGLASGRELTIPETYKDKPVTKIADGAFNADPFIRSITIPDSVYSIGESAFANCQDLLVVNIGSLVNNIGNDAFANCNSLQSINVDEENATFASETGVLYNASKSSIILAPADLGGDISIPDNLYYVHDYDFNNRNRITSVHIGSGVNSINVNAFDGCSVLASFTVDDDNNNYSAQSGILYNYEMSDIIIVPNALTGNVVIPDSVYSIGYQKFVNRGITSVDFGSGVYEINANAFDGCYSLESFTVDEYNYNYSAQDGVLYNDNLSEIVLVPLALSGAIAIPDNVYTISSSAFANRNITSVDLGSGVGVIGSGAFSGCSNLESFTVDEYNGTYFAQSGILYNYTKTHIIQVPSAISGAIDIPEGVQAIANNTFEYHNGITSVVIPSTVQTIGEYAFRDCDELTSVTIADGVQSIGVGAFYACDKISTISIPNSVYSIADYAFFDCEALTTVTIGYGLSSLGRTVFSDCLLLNSITVDVNNSNFSSKDGILYNGDKTGIILVPSALTGAVVVPSTVKTIGTVFSGNTGITSFIWEDGEGTETSSEAQYILSHENGVWTTDSVGVTTSPKIGHSASTTLTLTITNDGLFEFDYNVSSESNYDFLTINKNSTEVDKISGTGLSYKNYSANVVEGDVFTFIYSKDGSADTGEDKAYLKLSGNELRSINNDAFLGCTQLVSVTLPSDVYTIGDSAFQDCYALNSINIPSTVVRIGQYAFLNCNMLNSVTFADTANWYAGNTYIIEADLADIAIASQFLTRTYSSDIWTKQ